MGGLGGFAVGRATAPMELTPHPMGGVPKSAAAAAQFPLRITADKRGFSDAGGQPFHYLADTAWFALSRMTTESFGALAKGRRDRGFTALQLSLLDLNPSARNAYGHAPFAATGALDRPVVTKGDDNYWGTVDRCLDTCESLGLLACLVPSWYGGWGDSWRGYVSEANAASYGAFLAERFGGRKGIWWLLGGDNSPAGDGTAVQGVPDGLDRGPRVAETIAMGQAIFGGSAVKPLMSYHTARTENVEEYFGSEPWYQISAAYSGGDPAPFVAAEFEREKVRPVILWEAYYDERDKDPILDRTALRAQAYHAVLSGAAGFSYGHEQVWPVLDDWVKALDAPSARDMEVLSRVLATFVTDSLTPVREGDTTSGLIPSGYGKAGTTSRISAGSLPDGAGALIYFREPRAEAVVDTTVLDPDAVYKIRWIDPATGEQFFFGEGRSGSDLAVSWPSTWVDALLVLTR